MNLEILDRILDLSCRQAPLCENWSVKVQNDLEGQGQLRPFSKAALLIPRCTIGANLGILAKTGGELSRRQGHLGSRLSVKVQNDLEGQGQSRPFLKAKAVFSVIWQAEKFQMVYPNQFFLAPTLNSYDSVTMTVLSVSREYERLLWRTL